jgi:hypothetical protein
MTVTPLLHGFLRGNGRGAEKSHWKMQIQQSDQLRASFAKEPAPFFSSSTPQLSTT